MRSARPPEDIDDLAALSTGKVVAGGAAFQSIDSAQNQRRAAIGVANKPGWPSQVEG